MISTIRQRGTNGERGDGPPTLRGPENSSLQGGSSRLRHPGNIVEVRQ